MMPDPLLLICLHADPTMPSGVSDGGGTHAYLRELTAGLAMRGVTCHLVTRRQSPDLPHEVRVSPLTMLHRLDIGPDGRLDKRLLNTFNDQTVAGLDALWGRLPLPPRILHSVYWNSGRAAMALSEIRGVPFVHTVISNGRGRSQRGATGNAENREEIEEVVFKKAAKIFSISQEEKADLVTLYGLDPQKILVVGRPVDSAYVSPAQDALGHARRHWVDARSC